MDAITLLRNDHKTVEQLFKRFEKAGDRAHVEKRQIVDRIIEELSVHAAIEEQLFYPVARATVPNTEDIALESLEEHHIVKWVLSELDDLRSGRRALRRQGHRADRERPPPREGGGAASSSRRCATSSAARRSPISATRWRRRRRRRRPSRTPARPTPPGNAVVGAIAGVVDRVGDNVSGIAQGGVTAVQDLIATVLRNKKPKASPTGSKVARKRAQACARRPPRPLTAWTRLRSPGRAAATHRTATSGAKATATSARKSAPATKTTAKRAATTTGSPPRPRRTKTTAATTKRQSIEDGSCRAAAATQTSRVGNPVTQPPEVARRAAGAVDEPGRLRQSADFLRGRGSGQVWRRTVDDTWPAFRHHQRVEAPAQTTCTAA